MPRRGTAVQRNAPARRRPVTPVATRAKRRIRNPSYRAQTVYSGTVTNAGTVASPNFTISIAGPVTPSAVYFENATQGKTVWLTIAPASGQTLTVDFYARTVTLAGVTQSGVVTSDSRWWDLSSGANTIRSNVAATVTPNDAYF